MRRSQRSDPDYVSALSQRPAQTIPVPDLHWPIGLPDGPREIHRKAQAKKLVERTARVTCRSSSPQPLGDHIQVRMSHPLHGSQVRYRPDGLGYEAFRGSHHRRRKYILPGAAAPALILRQLRLVGPEDLPPNWYVPHESAKAHPLCPTVRSGLYPN